MTADLSQLCPPLRALYQQWLERCTAAGLNVHAIVTWRGETDQNLAKRLGRSNASWGESPHNCCDSHGGAASKAFDFACFDNTGKYITDGTDHRYAQAGAIAKQLGLQWGGDWHHPDFDHIELNNWKLDITPP